MVQILSSDEMVKWLWVICATVVIPSSLASSESRNRVSDPSFPYEFWKPSSVTDQRPSSSVLRQKSSKKSSYGFYFGEPTLPKESSPQSWTFPPIKVPKDIVGQVKEKTTINPLKDLTTHLSSIIPQYGKHPGATEAPPRYFPSRLANRIPEDQKRKAAFSNKGHPFAHHSKRWKWANSKLPRSYSKTSSSFVPKLQNQPFVRRPMKKRPKLIEVISIDRNREPPPHAFYAIEDSPNTHFKILHRNKTHSTYVSPERYNKEVLKQSLRTRPPTPLKQFPARVQRQKYNVLDYGRYERQKQFNHPHGSRKKYNENLIALIKEKLENKSKTAKAKYPQQQIPNKNNFFKENEINESPSLYNKLRSTGDKCTKHSHKPVVTSSYEKIHHPKLTNYAESSYPLAGRPFLVNPKQVKATPGWVPPPRPHPPKRKQGTEETFASRIKNFFNGAMNRTPKPAPNAYPLAVPPPEEEDPNHFLFYYHSKEDTQDYLEPNTKSIMERLASIQNAPATVVIPGGLAAVGLGLAYYYFNYVWYPTPVVTARLLKFLRSFSGRAGSDEDEEEIGKILEAFRGLESTKFEENFASDACRNRLVCQLHQDVPNLWEATKVISPFIKTQLQSSEYEKAMEVYMERAKEGSLKEMPCERIHDSCPLPKLPIKQLVDFFSLSNQGKSEYGESRVL